MAWSLKGRDATLAKLNRTFHKALTALLLGRLPAAETERLRQELQANFNAAVAYTRQLPDPAPAAAANGKPAGRAKRKRPAARKKKAAAG